jgi:hypothetical protein
MRAINYLSIKIRDEAILYYLKKIIDSSHYGFGKIKGIPIGNLTSQLFANIYLGMLDEYIKYELKQKFYYRYMDDFIILAENKEDLHHLKDKIRYFLSTLKLELHPKKQQIFPIYTSVDFVGYKIFPTYVRLRSSNIRRQRKRLRYLKKHLKKGIISKLMFNLKRKEQLVRWYGYTKYAESFKITDKLFFNPS